MYIDPSYTLDAALFSLSSFSLSSDSSLQEKKGASPDDDLFKERLTHTLH